MATPQMSPHSNGVSLIAFAKEHARPANTFQGCSSINDYDILGKLGEGTFGEVHRAKSRKTGAIVALKKILMHNEKDGFPITALREIKLLKLLSHPNVLKLEEMAVEHHTKPTDKRKRAIMYMVTPYMDHDLSGLLENPTVKLQESHIKCYLLQLLEGLRYLHANQILHRDMKAANLLINNKGILQIADFGLARHYDENPPKPGQGGGEARRDYTTLVVTRWYRPPELLLLLRKYTTAIDLWGVGCVFGEMLIGKPILSGDSDLNQLKIIFDLVGTPTDETMPGWRSLPGAESMNFSPHPSTLSQRFRQYGSGAISLLAELLKLDWRKRINAIDALEHPYFRDSPLPAKPGDLPTFEDSHELDRRKFKSQKAAPPPAPKGGTVGMGPAAAGGWGGEPTGNGHYVNGDSHNGHRHPNGSRYPHGDHRNGVPPPPPPGERRPAWARGRDERPDTRLPPRPPPAEYNYDGPRGERPENYRSRSRDLDRGPPRSRPGGPNVDTYIPSYGPDGGRRDDRGPRDRDERPRDRRPRDDRDDRPRHDRDRLDYDDRRSKRTRSRSRSPLPDRDRGDRPRERDPLPRVDQERDIYRR
ncbi:Pkinase-domain-containing protein [Mollisia scopiformis]|uniref:Serine/threonine-protein kinase BUR1 n=1 Tax=Mollisia scopiformis TaxID=149040 RepID=A0A194XJ58_MOLSC|nr:Pkinase-domain-containing protein [Mollisia scopiformis]KUJ20198.1 Pkinase-domain-containing protein [Mollisia scopiformis]